MKDFVLKFTALTIIMMIALSAGAKAPDVNGKVVDENGEPMPFVNVVMLSMPDSTYVQGGITDEQGTFKLTALQNGGLVKISYIGYQTLYINSSVVDLGTITLLPEATLLGEVVVLGTDYVIQETLKRQKEEYKRFKKTRSNYFYRQVGYTDRRCQSFLESFFTARSACQLSELSLATGRYVVVASMRTISPANFFTFAQVPVLSRQKHIPATEQLVPLHQGYAHGYQTDMNLFSDGERRVYVISFVPRDSNSWAVVGRLYVDAETFQLLKYEGHSTKEWVSHMKGSQAVVLPITHSFVVNYQHDNGFAEVSSVHFRTSYEADGHTFETTGMMFNVANRYATSRGTLRFDDSLMDIIGRQGLDSDFWQKNEIVKRTPVEEEAVEIFERDNLFGVY